MFSFPQDEKEQLFIACIIFSLVELSLFFSVISYSPSLFGDIILIICCSVPLFLFHELAHKYSAEYFGYSAQPYNLHVIFAARLQGKSDNQRRVEQ